MRHDGRAQDELRPLDLVPGFVETADGSVLFTYLILSGIARFLVEIVPVQNWSVTS
jgi:exosome complex RNA-binding protein Rrp42 (RNase PH superfamily)